jgi:hypothetical protein
VFSYVISLLANLNARGPSNFEIHINDISTPQIAVGSSAQQQTNEGSDPEPLLQASNVIAPRTSIIDAIQEGAPIIEEVQKMTTESVAFPCQSNIIEIPTHVWGQVLNYIDTCSLQNCLLPDQYLTEIVLSLLTFQKFIFCMFQPTLFFIFVFIMKESSWRHYHSWSEMNYQTGKYPLI